ncbi:signal recognition particle subunit [Coemansia nantahalensis]|uniref:Signal recognition particle subunit n=2 Tax=Coemansia TaxID=4863 RepID=A0ACC1LE58_9FUNG|nr:signal recognition particle subunit [Coemansia nantahalensis]KAJ2773475.1 signal recognition particle subunit [Coemansia nantahalensis]KAJ2805729.1 signal recognition particle subunit [Coemansia helicoidea]
MSSKALGKAPAMDVDVDDMDFPLPDAPAAAAPGGVRIGQSLGGMRTVTDSSQFKRWVCLYPVYFDRGRSLRDGRRVSQALAVDQPHGRQLAAAVKAAGFSVCLEPTKTHPRDFFTAGRVRVRLFDDAGRCVLPDVPSRKELIRRVARHMPLVDAPRDKEPDLKELIESGALPTLPGMGPGMPDDDDDDDDGGAPSGSGPAASSKAAKKAKAKKKGKSKTVV